MKNQPSLAKNWWITVVIGLLALIIGNGGCAGHSSAADPMARAAAPGRTIPYPMGIELGGAAGYEHCNDHSDSAYFVVGQDWYTRSSTANLTMLSQFATYQQTTEFTCGPAAILMTLYHWGVTDATEAEIAAAVHTDDTVGTTVEAVRDFFLDSGWQVDAHVSTQPRFADPDEFSEFVRANLQAGRPILVDWVRWDGHWAVIIGLDTMGTEYASDDVLVMADPYDTTDHEQDGYLVVGMEAFFYVWHEGLCAGKVEPYQQPYVVPYK